MHPRLRKFIGAFGFLAFLLVYALLIALFAPMLVPRTPWAELPFYVIAGLAWIPPIMPLIRWIETGKWRKPEN